jgi:WD repeat-containing protein 26
MDKQMCAWNLNGNLLYTWKGYRIHDCVISPDGQRLICVSNEKRIHVYNYITREEEYNVQLKVDLTCLSISQDSRYMLVNMSDNEIQLLDIETAEIVRRFMGQKQGHYVIRSAFGGASENFVVSGSEGMSVVSKTHFPTSVSSLIHWPWIDSRIYIWHKDNGTLVETLEGHSGCVNSVAWNPKDPCMFASAGDDHVVRM